ncbi:MAG: TIGR03960 family B12-binding radical SAM protein [Ruminococcaceae bacterium]|nr:TIGR03960 family B12-binding radical SAM protein [Oscillospiraceae bacterium]
MIENIDKILSSVSKPSWYIGTELNSVHKNKEDVHTRVAYCFPDLYDVGMSHLGMKLLYHMMNERDDLWCERVFAPNTDMEEILRKTNTPLFALESKDPLRDFDFVAFTLVYELSYTGILNMLDLAGIPIYAKDRTENDPIIIAGGPCMCNPEPIADFFDVIDIGEGEENLNELFDLYKECGKNKNEFLEKAKNIRGMYVPNHGTKQNEVVRAVIEDLSSSYYPDKLVVPFAQVVHDRISLEIMRGCIRGCRFCQAGMIYRPYRQKSVERLKADAVKLCESTGYDEISLLSLSTSDFQKLPELAESLREYCIPRKISLALPSLRIDNFSKEISDEISSIRKTGLTFAPEAGTQRLRDVINKNITDEDIERSCKIAFENGASAVKLYFMIGLPTETDEDIIGIAKTAQQVVEYFYKYATNRSRGISVTISCATFVPKPHTPFQWEAQLTLEEINRRQNLLKNSITSKKVHLKYHDADTTVLEGVFARGDRKIAQLIEKAWRLGCRLDAWTEHFDFARWQKAAEECGINFYDYTARKRSFDEELPWNFVNIGVSQAFMQRECEKAYNAETTPNCIEKCSGCGMNKICKGDVCP